MKILILGANGMLGHALMNEFANEDIIVCNRPEFDITRFKELNLKIKEANPEIIINSAAYTDVDGCETNSETCHLVNGQAVGNLAKTTQALNIIFVHYSTDYVFDGQKEQGYTEDEQTAPLNVYGRSKELGEQLLQKYGHKYYLIRTAWLYGSHGKNFVDTILDLSKKQKQLKIVNDQFGNPTSTKDLAKATRQILMEKKNFGIYHRTNYGSCSWYDLARKIKEIKRLNVEVMPVSSTQYKRAAKRPKYSKLINTKLPDLRFWGEALKEYLKSKT